MDIHHHSHGKVRNIKIEQELCGSSSNRGQCFTQGHLNSDYCWTGEHCVLTLPFHTGPFHICTTDFKHIHKWPCKYPVQVSDIKTPALQLVRSSDTSLTTLLPGAFTCTILHPQTIWTWPEQTDCRWDPWHREKGVQVSEVAPPDDPLPSLTFSNLRIYNTERANTSRAA